MYARFVRQILVPEIGEEGQRRILASSARVGEASLAGEVASLYARAAGFREVASGAIDQEALGGGGVIRNESAKQVLAGSRATLAAIRDAIAPSPNDRSAS